MFVVMRRTLSRYRNVDYAIAHFEGFYDSSSAIKQ